MRESLVLIKNNGGVLPIKASAHVLVAGDVITLEPGCYRPGFGGCRLEDLVLVTDDGGELLTDFPYELEP